MRETFGRIPHVSLIPQDEKTPPECHYWAQPAVSNRSKRKSRLRAELRTAFGAAIVQNLTAGFCCHACTKAVTVLTNPVRWLERALHRVLSGLWPNPKKDSNPINISEPSFKVRPGPCQRASGGSKATFPLFARVEMFQNFTRKPAKLKQNRDYSSMGCDVGIVKCLLRSFNIQPTNA